jgi:tripartite motif-containing protein 71
VFVSEWVTYGTGNSQFKYPYGVDVAPVGSVYVSDRYNRRIQRFTSEGVFVSKKGKAIGSYPSTGTHGGAFNEPVGVAVAPDGSVYVADTRNHRIQKFSVGP